MKKKPRFVALPVILLLPILLSAADLRLIDAVRRGDRNAVRALLRNRVDVNVAQPDGSTALLLAADRNDPELVDLLIKAGANVNARNDYGATPLYAASAGGNIENTHGPTNTVHFFNHILQSFLKIHLALSNTAPADAVQI